MKENLFDQLKVYGESDAYPFHMPGHKRNVESGPLSPFYQYDITEIDGFDNLHQPEGILLEAQKRAAKLYGSEETFFLVNGSTSGILSAVSAVAGRGKKLLIARNCHKAVYHAAFLNRLKLEYLYPEMLEEYGLADGFSAEQVEEKIVEIAGDIAGIVITSPTYDGMISDVGGIVKAAHRYGIPVIIDQAHGAHFGFHPKYPQSAIQEGADLVIHSVHKTLPAPTQTALLHVKGELVDRDLLRKYLRIYQSSSPSYLLMAGIDSCMELVEKEGKARLENLLQLRKAFVEKSKALHYIHIYPSMEETGEDCVKKWRSGKEEPGRLVLSVRGSGLTGQMLHDILKDEYQLQMEMYGEDYVVAILSMMDKREGFDRLAAALKEIDRKIEDDLCAGQEKYRDNSEAAIVTERQSREKETSVKELQNRPKTVCSISEAFMAPCKEVPLSEADGQTAADFINLYPPGIPFLVPGEQFDKDTISVIMKYLKNGYTLQGVKSTDIPENALVKVVC